jgi:formate dehydrogenase subunit gamma
MRGSTAEPAYVLRFTLTERAFHWVHALSFLMLLATGVALYIPALTEAFGSRALLRDLHLGTAATWVVALVGVVILGDRRALRQTLRDLDMLDEDDSVWSPRRPYVPQGRFNAGQKRNAALTAAFAVLFIVSGLLMWYGARNNDFSLASAVLLHDVLTLISIVLVAGHLYLALVHPSTRHSLRGITRGTVRTDWARQHHTKWVPEDSDTIS